LLHELDHNHLVYDRLRPSHAGSDAFARLVLDIQLKGMSGLDLRRRLSAVLDATPVIFITAHDDPEIRAQAEASGCAEYFHKMDSGADVLAAIRHSISLNGFKNENGAAHESPARTKPE
jgi:FixJ family two-component response regulator